MMVMLTMRGQTMALGVCLLFIFLQSGSCEDSATQQMETPDGVGVSRVRRSGLSMLRLGRGLQMLRLGKRMMPTILQVDRPYVPEEHISLSDLFDDLEREEYSDNGDLSLPADDTTHSRYRRSVTTETQNKEEVPNVLPSVSENVNDDENDSYLAYPEFFYENSDGDQYDAHTLDGIDQYEDFDESEDENQTADKRPMNMLRLGKRPMNMLRLGKRAMNMLRLGKRPMNMLRLGKRPMNMLRLGKRPMNMLRLGKRDVDGVLDGEEEHFSMNPEEEGFDEEKRPMNMLRLGKRPMNMLRLGKRPMNMLRLGKRPMNMLRLGKRPMNMLRLGKRPMNMLRLGKRPMNMLRLGKRD